MEREKRLQRIMEIVQRFNTVTVEYLENVLGVSGSTVRSDLRLLVQNGKVRREHGRVVRVPVVTVGDKQGLPSFEQRMQIHRENKERIARIAETLVDENDSIILDSSSTCYYLANCLLSSGKTLTVVTNSISSAYLLNKSPRLQVILVGGTIGIQNNTEGSLGVGVFKHLNIKKCFVSGYGISVEQGITDFSLLEIELKHRFLEVAQNIYGLMDSSKFGVVSVGTFGQLHEFDQIITDDGISAETFNIYSQHTRIVTPSSLVTV